MEQQHNISPEDWERLEAYLAGSLSQPEQAAFKTRLETEPALQQARLLIIGIMESSLTQRLDSFHDSGVKKIHSIAPKKNLRAVWMAVAAMVIVMLGVFVWRGSDRTNLAAAYFEPDPGLPTAMSAAADYAFGRGMVDYKSGKYQQAIQAWRPLLAATPANDTLQYFSGVSFLALGQPDSASHYLRPVWNNNASSFRMDAGWYLALALLDQGNKPEARSILQQTTHPKKEELLSRIK